MDIRSANLPCVSFRLSTPSVSFRCPFVYIHVHRRLKLGLIHRLYSLSTYDESPKDPPRFMRWLFRIDCMDYFWYLLTMICIQRPSYSSEPKHALHLTASQRERNSNPTPVTLYRLFVCFTTALFGLTKAATTYSGYPGAANWIDWTSGVIITLMYVRVFPI